MSAYADARQLCQALARDTEGRPMRWRMAAEVAELAGLKGDKGASAITEAVANGWMIEEGGHSVSLTEAGRRL